MRNILPLCTEILVKSCNILVSINLDKIEDILTTLWFAFIKLGLLGLYAIFILCIVQKQYKYFLFMDLMQLIYLMEKKITLKSSEKKTNNIPNL